MVAPGTEKVEEGGGVHGDGAYPNKHGHDGEAAEVVAHELFHATHRVEDTLDGNHEEYDSSQHEVDSPRVAGKRVRDLGGVGSLPGDTSARLWVVDKDPCALLDREGKWL